MKPPRFEYFAPTSVAQAVELLSEHAGTARPLAGGQSLVPLMHLRLSSPSQLVDINKISDLDYVRSESKGVAVGAITRQRTAELDPIIRDEVPLLAGAIRYIGHFQIRNRGTVGGSVAHADPAAEIPAVLVALGGNITVESVNGSRMIPADEISQFHFTTSLEPGELLTQTWFSKPPEGSGWSFQEVARRRGDFALVAAAVTMAMENGEVTHVGVGLSGVGPSAIRGHTTEDLILGETYDEEVARSAGNVVRDEIEPLSDIHGSSDYRRAVAGVLVERAVIEAAHRAGSTRA